MSVEPKQEIDRLKSEIIRIISGSKVPEDLAHAHNTLAWLLRIRPNADDALQISALGHDIERAIDTRKVKREDYLDYNAFKDAHAKTSALILSETVQAYHLEEDLIDDVSRIVSRHETGGDARSDLIREADALSFFDVNLPLFYEREGWKRALRRCLWGYKRLSKETKRKVREFLYDDDEINSLIKSVIKDDRQ